MNSKTRRISKLEAIAGMGKHKPCKLIISQILDGVKTVHCEQILPYDPKQREDIEFTVMGVDLSKFPKSL
jgi:hypothetical protein